MKTFIMSALLIVVAMGSCTKDENEVSAYSINGKVQKGPFLIGTDITISELDAQLNPTGKVFFATITDNMGSFNVPHVKLVSDYVTIKAQGAYFNELDNAINLDLGLTCIANLNNGEAVNLNILTHLTKDRIIKLVSEGKSFKDAQSQTNNEFLKIFNLENYNIGFAEKLDLTKVSEGNDILFALNMILIGSLSDIRLTEFLTRFITDFASDGKLDNRELQAQIISNALYSAPVSSWNNLKTRYEDLGLNIGENHSSKYITEFITKSDYKGFFDAETPKSTSSGINLLTLADGEKLDSVKSYTIALSKSDTTQGTIYLNLDVLDSGTNVEFLNPFWHSEKNEQVLYGFDNVDNLIQLSGTGKIKLQYWISSDNYSSVNVIKYFTW